MNSTDSTKNSFELITYERIGNVAMLALERPEKKNAINVKLRDEIETAVRQFDGEDTSSVLVITGSGDSFSAGADINELHNRISDQSDELDNVDDALDFQRFILPSNVIENIEKPVIAMVNGHCFGGGLELALSCDIRIASKTAQFGSPEMNLGKFPGDGATQRLPRESNVGMAQLMVLSGEPISAEEALTCGLVQKVYDDEKLKDRTLDLAQTIAQQPTTSLILGKKIIRLAEQSELQAGLQMEDLLSRFLEVSSERKKRVEEFFED